MNSSFISPSSSTTVYTGCVGYGLLSTLIVCNPISSITLNLPDSALSTGQSFSFINKTSNVVTISQSGTDTIDSSSSPILLSSVNSTLKVTSDGSGLWSTAL